MIETTMSHPLNRIVCFSLLSVVASSATVADAAEPAPGKQVELQIEDEAGKYGCLAYLPASYDEDKEKQWPLVLFLHGRGESYGPLSLVAKWGPPRFAARGDELPFVLLSPQCPGDGRWSDETRQAQLQRLLDSAEKQYRVDPKRIYLTGLSMGGYGSWTLAAKSPKRFAAVAPVCGGGDADDAEKLKSLPIWVFHGDQDRAVPIERSIAMVEAIKKAGGKSIRFTTLEHVGHNSWSSAYALPELWGWMLKQQLP